MAWAVLRLIDGDTTISLLNTDIGIHLDSWRPSAAKYKDGGVWSDNKFAHGRKLVMRRFENITETMGLIAKGSTFDDVTRLISNLRRLLDHAAAYWEGGFGDCVYLEARSQDETLTRYAMIYAGSVPEDSDLVAPEYVTDYIAQNLSLTLEHFLWQDAVPGSNSALKIGNAPQQVATTTADQVVVANKYNTSIITHIFKYDASLGSFSGNLYADTEIDLFDPLCGTGDIIYFGSNFPFCSIVFHLTQAAVYNGGSTLSVQYWNGATWEDIDFEAPTIDDTTPLDATGLYSMHFVPPALWATRTVNGVANAYWVAMTINGGFTTNPHNGGQAIYTATRPYAEVNEVDISGDTLAWIEAVHTPLTSFFTTHPHTDGYQRLIVASRSTIRGANFSPYLNSLGQNPTGVSSGSGANVTGPVYPSAPAGQTKLYTPVAHPEAMAMRVFWRIAAANAPDWYGRFRVFMLGEAGETADGDFTVRLRVRSWVGDDYIGDTVNVPPYGWPMVDLGEFELPPVYINGEASQFDLYLDAAAMNANALGLYIHCLLLVPVDETILDIYDTYDRIGEIARGLRLDIDAISDPDDMKVFSRYIALSESPYGNFMPIGERFSLLPNSTQRVYFIACRAQYATPGQWSWHPSFAATVTMYKLQHYLSNRGSR